MKITVHELRQANTPEKRAALVARLRELASAIEAFDQLPENASDAQVDACLERLWLLIDQKID